MDIELVTPYKKSQCNLANLFIKKAVTMLQEKIWELKSYRFDSEAFSNIETLEIKLDEVTKIKVIIDISNFPKSSPPLTLEK